MAFVHILFLVTLVGVSLAGPLSTGSTDVCRSECPVSNAGKLSFVTGRSYVYSYKGLSEVVLQGRFGPFGPSSSLDWEAEVILSWLSSCQVVVGIRRPIVNGHAEDHIMTELLTQKTMMATIKDGVVVGICADPNDHPTGLNMKKGIISSIQNVLPQISPAIVNRTFVEDDIVGRCPTVYTVKNLLPTWFVSKEKNHKECTGQHVSAAESPVTSWLLRSPVMPLNESRSDCIQHISKADKVMTNITCRDENIVKISLEKYMIATQESTLSLIQVENKIILPALIDTRQTNLSFEVVPQPPTQEVVPKVKILLKQLCASTHKNLTQEAATYMEKMIGLLHRVPDQTVRQLLSEIRSGYYCRDNAKRLESLFLDAIALVGNAGAIEVMVEEVASGKISGGRTPLYTIALHLLQKPSLKSVEAVSPLFYSEHVPSYMVLAAGSLVREYCRFHPQCVQDAPVKATLQKLSDDIYSSCSYSVKPDNQEKKMKVLSALKAVGNIGSITKSLETIILRCLNGTFGSDPYVRVAATQAFRHASCNNQPTLNLLRVATNFFEDTEVRIASYIAAIRCASYEQVQRIVHLLSVDANTAVRAFVFSHLHNVQRSDAPFLRGLRYNLTSIVIPKDYRQDFRKYSRNIDLSYYSPSLGIGAGIDTNIIYRPESYFPTQLQTNITADIFDNVINIGEFGIRTTDFEALIDVIFGPDSYFQNTHHSQIMNDMLNEYRTKGPEILEYFEKRFYKSGEKPDWPNLLKIFDRKFQPPKVDTFGRIFGQEILFSSFSPNHSDLRFDVLLEKILEFIERLVLTTSDMTVDSARAMQLNSEYFIPTIQGIPLQIKTVSTGIVDLQVENDITFQKSTSRMSPALSSAFNSFIGYTVGAKTGLRTRISSYVKPNNSLHLNIQNEKIEVVLDMPSKLRLLSGNYSSYMMNKMPSKEDQRLAPAEGYPVVKQTSCVPVIRSALGLEFCWNFTAPDYARSHIYPLGDANLTIDVEKRKPHKEVLKMIGTVTAEGEGKLFALGLQLEAPGSRNPKKGEVGLEYKSDNQHHSVKVFGKGASGRLRTVQVDLNSKISSHGGFLNMIAYYGKQIKVSSSDQVVVLKLQGGKREDEMEGKLDLKTKKIVAKYIHADIEVDVAAKLVNASGFVPNSLEIRKFEMNINFPNTLNTTNFIRKHSSAEGPSNIHYNILSFTSTPSREILNITGMVKSTGEILKMNHETRFNLSVNASGSCFESESAFVWTHQLKQTLFSVKKGGVQQYCFLANASATMESSPSPNYTTKAEIQIPSLISTYKLEGSVERKNSSDYLKLVTKREDSPLYEIEGPVDVELNKNVFREKSELTIKNINKAQEYTLKTRLFGNKRKYDAMLDWKTSGESVFTVEGDIEKEGETFSSSVGLTISKIIDAKLRSQKSKSLLQLVLNGYLRPNTPDSQKVRGSSSVDFVKNLLKAKLAYDLDKDPKKKVKLTANYDYDFNQTYVSVKGDVDVLESKYRYNTEALLGMYAQTPNPKNAIKIKVIGPDNQEFLLDSACILRNETSSKSVTYKALLKYPPERVYNVHSQFIYDFENAPAKMLLKGQAKVKSPELKDITVAIDSGTDMVERDQKAHYMMEIYGPELPLPIKTDIEVTNSDESFRAKLDVVLGSSNMSMGSHIEVAKNESHSIGDASMEITMKPSAEADRYYKFSADKNHQNVDLRLIVDGRKILMFEQSQPQKGVWWARLTTPSRRAEVHSKYSPNSFSLSMYPNRMESEDKYEAEGHYRHSNSFSGSYLDAGAKIGYPGAENGIHTSLAIQNATSKGTLEIDIFRDPKEKILIEIRTLKTAEHSYKAEADIKIPTMETPRVDVEVALSPEVKRMEILIKKSPSAEPTFASVLSYNHATDKDVSLYANLTTPSDTFEIVSSLHLHELFQCRGGSINGTFLSTEHGSYDFASSVCAPGYIEFGAKNSSDDKMFIAKLGMKNPTSLKVALDLVYNSTHAITVESVKKMESTLNLYGRHEYIPKIPILLVGAKLWSPRMVTLDVQYNVTGIQEYMENVVRPSINGARNISQELVEQFSKDFSLTIPEISSKLIEEMKKLKEKLRDEFDGIFKEIGVILPSAEQIQEWAKEVIHRCSELSKKTVEQIETLLENSFGIKLADIHEGFKYIDQCFQTCLKNVYEESKSIFTAIQRGREAMMEVPFLQWIIETVEGSSIWDWIKEKFEEIKNKFENEWEAFKKFFEHYYGIIKDELKAIYHWIFDNFFTRKTIKWTESWLIANVEEEDSTLVGSLVTNFYSFWMNKTMGLIRVQVPLRHSVASISVALPYVGIPFFSSGRRKPSLTFQNLIHPYSASGKLERGKLTTFDGLVVPIIYSKCEILLTQVFGDKVAAKMPRQSHTEITVFLQSGKRVKMFLEVGRPPRVPILNAFHTLILPDMNITKVSEEEVKAELQGLIIHLKRDILQIEAKPWAFSKTEGLMGNHDSEKSNDAHQGAEIKYYPHSDEGVHHITPDSARKLIERYRLDKSCKIPRV